MNSDTNAVSDEALAGKAQAGSLPAFEELVYRYESRIFKFLRQRVCCDHDALDLTQNVFVRAYRKIDRFSPRYPFRSWLFTIARRESIDHYRRSSSVEFTLLPQGLSGGSDPGREVASRDACERLWQLARERLPENQFSALYLRAVEQMSVKEIAGAMRKTQAHVKVLLHRARRKMLEEQVMCREEMDLVRDTVREMASVPAVQVVHAEAN